MESNQFFHFVGNNIECQKIPRIRTGRNTLDSRIHKNDRYSLYLAYASATHYLY